MLSHERRYNAMTFNVKIDAVRELTTNGPTYMKGRQYYRQGRVRHLSFDQEMGVILAQVEGTRAYNIRIILNGKGELHDATCTCSAFASYWGICQHIAAALLYGIDAFGEQKPTSFRPRSRPSDEAEINTGVHVADESHRPGRSNL